MLLQNVKSILDQQKFECALIDATKNIPFDQLLVFISMDTKKRERLLEIFCGQLPLSPEMRLQHEGTKVPDRLQFRVKLPFKVQDLALNQVSSLLHYINQLLDLPGFELNELNGEVSYRYVWMTNATLITTNLVMGIVGAVMLNIKLFDETIEALAEGKTTFDDLLSEIVKIAESIKTN